MTRYQRRHERREIQFGLPHVVNTGSGTYYMRRHENGRIYYRMVGKDGKTHEASVPASVWLRMARESK